VWLIHVLRDHLPGLGPAVAVGVDQCVDPALVARADEDGAVVAARQRARALDAVGEELDYEARRQLDRAEAGRLRLVERFVAGARDGGASREQREGAGGPAAARDGAESEAGVGFERHGGAGVRQFRERPRLPYA